MQTWAKRGIQTALVTGGLLMLGTGIASAHENVDPDRPASPLDGHLAVPVNIDNNAIGTPLGQYNLPGYHHTFTTPDVTKVLPQQAAKPLNKVASRVTGPLQQAVQHHSLARPADTTQAAAPDDPTRGNRISGDLAVPVDVAGNAIALGGPAQVTNDETHDYSHSSPVVSNGDGGFLAGNVIKLDWALPIQITGNAVGAGGAATATSHSQQSTSVGGDVMTSGDGGGLAGNILAGQFATPVDINGNALSGGGTASSHTAATNDATAGGALTSDGDNGLLAGNAGGLPAGLPVELDGNALSALGGRSESTSQTGSDATAGDSKPGRSGPDAYIDTTGNHSVLSGTAAGPALAGPAVANGNAGTLLGHATAGGGDDNSTDAGGFLSTYGKHAAGSGTVINPNLAAPTGVVSNALAGAGLAGSSYDNTVDSTAGWGSYTNGTGSVLSATNLAAPVAYPVDAFANAASAGGIATTVSPENDVTATAGGYNGTIGPDSVLSANELEAPLAGAAEAFGNAGGALGLASSDGVVENKKVTSGDGGNANDDAGVVSANLVQLAGALPVQVFSGSLAAGGISHSAVTSNSDITGGGNTRSAGEGGTVAGNIAQLPVALPAQVFGQAASVAGHSDSEAAGDTASTAGGDAHTTGSDGSVTGNVITAPTAGAAQLFGDAAGLIANDSALATNETTSTAGGDVITNGDGGALAGNVAGAQLLPVVQGFGDAVGVVANGKAVAGNDTSASSGGDITTSGVGGEWSGNIVDFPVAFAGQAFGDGAGVFANEFANGSNVLTGQAGGTDTSAGDRGNVSGIVAQHPIGLGGQIYDVAVPIASHVVTRATNATDVMVGDEAAQHIFDFDGGSMPHLAAHELPTLPNVTSVPQVSQLPTRVVTLPAAAMPMSTQSARPISINQVPVPGLDSLSGSRLNPGNLPEVGDLVPSEALAGETPALSSLDGATLLQRFAGDLSGNHFQLPPM